MNDTHLEIFIDTVDGRSVTEKKKYRLYFGDRLLSERFFPDNMFDHRILIEKLILKLDPGTYKFKLVSDLDLVIRKVLINADSIRPFDTEFDLIIE